MTAEFVGSPYKNPTKKTVWNPSRARWARGGSPAKNDDDLPLPSHFSIEKTRCMPILNTKTIIINSPLPTLYGMDVGT